MQTFSLKSKQGFYFGSVAERGDWCINVISGVMSVLCGLRWGLPGWLWADSVGVRGRECVMWTEVGSLSSACSWTQKRQHKTLSSLVDHIENKISKCVTGWVPPLNN